MYLNFSLHDQDTHLAELWHEGFIKNLFANCRSRVGPSTLLNFAWETTLNACLETHMTVADCLKNICRMRANPQNNGDTSQL